MSAETINQEPCHCPRCVQWFWCDVCETFTKPSWARHVNDGIDIYMCRVRAHASARYHAGQLEIDQQYIQSTTSSDGYPQPEHYWKQDKLYYYFPANARLTFLHGV
jgi:hypothetical protein